MYSILKLDIKIKLLIINKNNSIFISNKNFKNKLLIGIKTYLKISLKIHLSTQFRLIIIFRI